MSEIQCTRCEYEGSSAGIRSHWGRSHDGPMPEGIESQLKQTNQHSDDCDCSFCEPEKVPEHPEDCNCASCSNYGVESHPENCGCLACTGTEEHPPDCDCTMCDDSPTGGADTHAKDCECPWCGYPPSGRNQRQLVEETGHEVMSGWEEEVDKLLHSLDQEYSYENTVFEFSNGRQYKPDFIMEKSVIEVKGRVNEGDIKRAELMLKEYSEWKYIVVGSEVPCDVHIPWNERERLREVTK